MPLNALEVVGGGGEQLNAAGAAATTTTATATLDNTTPVCVDLSVSSPTHHHTRHHGASMPACCEHPLCGPHTSTLRMNPYVRCVYNSGVPEIRSLKELLAQKNQPDPAEPDTPCMRPSHAPESTWQPQHPRPAAPPPGTAGGSTSWLQSHADSVEFCEALPSFSLTANARRGIAASPSPVLAFTADSVATPNTFATVATHEQRIISHLTRRLRMSVRRHHDMPLGEPMEMLLSAGEEEDEEYEEEEPEPYEDDGCGDVSMEAYDGDACGDEGAGDVPLLPCSTREKAAEAEAAAAAAIPRQPTRSPPSRVADSGSSSSRSAPSTAGTTPNPERSLARPLAASVAAAALQQRQQQHHLSLLNNERIVSPHSSSGMLCEFPGVEAALMDPQRLQTAHQQQQPKTLSGPHLRGTTITSPLRSYPAPVAKLEESPYHYIMRNYVGGTFLYYSTPESKEYFLRLCHRVVAQVRPLLEQETLSPQHGLFPRINAPAFVFGDIHGNFEDLSFFLKRLLIFHDFNLTPANILCLGDYVDRGPFSLECVMLLFSLKIMNASKIVMLRGNHEDRVVCGDLQTYGRGCFLGQCQTVFGYTEGMRLFREVTALFKYLPLAAELVIPSTPNLAFLRSQQTVMHPNLYVSQPAVLLHDDGPATRSSLTAKNHATAVGAAASGSGGTRPPHPCGEVASGCDHEDALAKSPNTTSAVDAGIPALPTSAPSTSMIADASLTRGQPSRHEAHEERILCTHGGIPRFDKPPLEEDSLRFLRSLSFPRLLTLFPNNPMVKDDPECAPDYFVRHELQTLWRRYPSTAPPEFTAASRREAAEASAAAAALAQGAAPGASLPFVCSKSQRRQLSRLATSASTASCSSGTAVTDEACRSGSSSSAASSSTSSPTSRQQEGGSLGSNSSGRPLGQSEGGKRGTTLLRRCASRDFIPQLTEDHVRNGWYTMFDLLWSDPTPFEPGEVVPGVSPNAAAAAASRMHINEWGFGINTRGSNVVSFSAKAVDTFLTAHRYSMLFRAHQEKAHGLRWSKSNKVLTIFSSSNYMGHRNGAGCVVVAANGEIQMIEKVCM